MQLGVCGACRLKQARRRLSDSLESVSARRPPPPPSSSLSRMQTLIHKLAERHVTSPHPRTSPRPRPRPRPGPPPRTCLLARPFTNVSAIRTAPRPLRLSCAPFASRPAFRPFSTWLQRLSPLKSQDPPEDPSDCHEDASKAALWENAMKGRQPADLMLRCECFTTHSARPRSLTLPGPRRHDIGFRRSVTSPRSSGMSWLGHGYFRPIDFQPRASSDQGEVFYRLVSCSGMSLCGGMSSCG